ncbi:MAG: hypothetical protein ACRDJJ_08275 [Actinomycetota bacterium]
MSSFKRFATALVVLALVAGACSARPDDGGGSAGPAAGNQADKSAGAERGKGKGGKAKASKGAGGGEKAGEEGTTAGDGSDDSANPFGSGGSSALATASARVPEPQPDATRQGALVPDYAEVLAAAIEGLGKSFRITLTFAGEVPQQMPDENTFMITQVALQMSEDESYAFGAQGSNKGWEAMAGSQKEQSGKQAQEFPGKLEVTGNRIVMTIPWRYVGGPTRFQWVSNSYWFSTVANTTHSSYDPVPNQRRNAKKPNLATYPN